MSLSPTPASLAPASTPPGAFAALQHTGFRWLLLGTILSNAALWIQQVTLSWLVYDMTGSGTLLGGLNLARAVATVGLAVVAGVAIDRLPYRVLMLAVNAWLFLISLILGLALLAGVTALWPLFLFTFLGGIGQALDQPLRQTAVFTLVPRAVAPGAIALVQTGWALMRSLGPALGGFLILWVGPGGNFLLQASAYTLIALTILRLRFPARAEADARALAPGGMRAGLRYVLGAPRTRAFLLMGWVLPLFIIPIFSALPPIFAKDVFGGGPQVLGALLSAVGVGGIAGGIAATALSRIERQGLLQLGALLLLGLALFGFGLSPNLPVALALFVAAGFFELIFLSTNQTLLQLSIPDALRGRVMGLVTLNAGLAPVGALVAGVGADLIGPRAITLWLAAAVLLIAVVVSCTSTTIRNCRLHEALAGAG